MSTVEFNIDVDSLERMCNTPRECRAMIHLLERFPHEAEASYINIIGTIDYEYLDDERVPYGDTYATLPPSWELERAKIDEIVLEAHTTDTGVPNMPKVQIKEQILDLSSLPSETLDMLCRLVNEYYNKNFREFKDMVEDSNYYGGSYGDD